LQYQDELHGSLLIIADRVIELIYLKYLKAAITYDKEIRIETYPFPRDGVREAVYNALLHCNWADSIPIQIRIEDEAMYISNCCTLPSDWTAETLLERHKSRPYNPDIANIFFRAGYVETWGRGIQKICEACRNHGISEPEYEMLGGDITVKFTELQNSKASSNTPKHQNEVIHWNNHGKKQIVWRCVTRLNDPGVECQARTLSEVQLQNLVLEAINKVLGGKQRAIKVLETNISEVLGNAYSEELERIRKQIEKQQTLLVKMTAASEDYSKVVDKIYALQKEQKEAMKANVNYKAGKERIQEMIEYLKSQPKRVTAYDEQLVRKLIEKITMYDDHLDFLFKSGIQIEIKG